MEYTNPNTKRPRGALIASACLCLFCFCVWTRAFSLRPFTAVCSVAPAFLNQTCDYDLPYATQSCTYITVSEYLVLGAGSLVAAGVVMLTVATSPPPPLSGKPAQKDWVRSVAFHFWLVCMAALALPGVFYYCLTQEQFYCDYEAVGRCDYNCTTPMYGLSQLWYGLMCLFYLVWTVFAVVDWRYRPVAPESCFTVLHSSPL